MGLAALDCDFDLPRLLHDRRQAQLFPYFKASAYGILDIFLCFLERFSLAHAARNNLAVRDLHSVFVLIDINLESHNSYTLLSAIQFRDVSPTPTLPSPRMPLRTYLFYARWPSVRGRSGGRF